MSDRHGYRVIAVMGGWRFRATSKQGELTSMRLHRDQKKKTPFGQKRNKALRHRRNIPVLTMHFHAASAA